MKKSKVEELRENVNKLNGMSAEKQIDLERFTAAYNGACLFSIALSLAWYMDRLERQDERGDGR